MRIISGTAGGVPIQVPKTLLRPTSDRVREAVFSILSDRVSKARVLDLCAGSGAYGLECLSRGASSVDFVEVEKSSAETIKQNLARTRLAHGSVVCAKAEVFLRSATSSQVYDLVFADPPYKKGPQDRDLSAELLASDLLPPRLNDDGLFILEVFSKHTPPAGSHPNWQCVDERRYGDSVILFFKKSLSLPSGLQMGR